MSAAIDDKLSEKCLCGARKCVHESFCTECYFALPIPLRDDLWSSDLALCEAAYEAASQFLREVHA